MEDLILSAQQKLISDLENISLITDIPDIKNLTHRIDHLVHENIMSYAQNIFFDRNIDKQEKYENKATFICKGNIYDVRMNDCINDETVLKIAIMKSGINNVDNNRQQHNIQIEATGKYKKVDLCISPELSSKVEPFTCVTEKIVNTAYYWLNSSIFSVLGDIEMEMVKELYRYLHAIYHNSDITNNLWLSTVSDNKSHYLINSSVTNSSMDIVSSSAKAFRENPYILLGEFLNCAVPIEKTFGLMSVQENKCIDVELGDSKYSDTHSSLLKSQISIFGSFQISLFPIYRGDGVPYLVATFPTDKKELILPNLITHRSKLSTIFLKDCNKIQKIYRYLNKNVRRMDSAAVGEFLGGLVSGVVKSS